MNVLKSFLVFLAVCVLAFIAAAPNLAVSYPLPSEVWILQAASEMNRNFHIIPMLNNQSLGDHNPLLFMLLSLLPSADMFSSRLVTVLCGVFLSAGVFLFGKSLWGRKAGAFSVLFMASSLAFLQTFGILNLIAVPHTLAVLAVLLFSRTYLKEGSFTGYMISYLLITLAALLGGLNLLIFFLLSAILLVLFDLSPQRFLGIKALFALGLFFASLLLYYVIFRWYGGPATISASFFPAGQPAGFWKGSWAFLAATFPWLPLFVPAWMMTERPEQWEAWRQLLPAKISFVLVLVMIWLTGKTTAPAQILAVPFGSIILGYWAAHGLRMPKRFISIGVIAKFIFALLLLIFLCVQLAGDLRGGPDFGYLETGIYVGLFVVLIGVILCVGRRTQTAVYLTILLMLGLGCKQAVMVNNTSLERHISYISGYQPLLVYEDDLSMRGYLGYAGKTPTVVKRGFVPLGSGAYLAVTTSDTDEMLEKLAAAMQTELVTSSRFEKTYALIKVSPQHSLAKR